MDRSPVTDRKSRNVLTGNGVVPRAIFIVMLLFSIHFWTLRFIPQKLNPENLIVWVTCILSFFMVLKKPGLRFRNAIIVLILGILANCLASFINLSQNPKLSILSFTYYYFILLYFLLHYLELNRKFMENVVIIFGIIYAIIFTIQFKIYPRVIVSSGLGDDAGNLQLELLGHGFLMLAYLLVLNRFLLGFKPVYIILALGFLMVQFKSDFRTLIAGALLITVLMVIRTFRFDAKNFIMIFVVSMVFVVMLFSPKVTPIIDNMINETQNNLDQGEDYVRRVQFDFYYKRYPRDFSYYLIGGGKPAGNNLWVIGSNWEMNYNIVWVDIGLLGFFVVVGGIALFGLLWYTFKAVFMRLPRDMLYLNFYFLYLFIVSFTNEEIFDDGIFTVQAVALYLIDLGANERKESKKADKEAAGSGFRRRLNETD